jgi:hypothetical protein
MKKRPFLYLAFLGAICMIHLGTGRIAAQSSTPVSATATITSASGEERHLPNYDDMLGRVGLAPEQVVTVTLQFPANRAGKPVNAGSLDGGNVSLLDNASQLLIATNGTARFQFQADASPGLYRVIIQLEADTYRLEFYVLNLTHPEKNPARLTVVY